MLPSLVSSPRLDLSLERSSPGPRKPFIPSTWEPFHAKTTSAPAGSIERNAENDAAIRTKSLRFATGANNWTEGQNWCRARESERNVAAGTHESCQKKQIRRRPPKTGELPREDSCGKVCRTTSASEGLQARRRDGASAGRSALIPGAQLSARNTSALAGRRRRRASCGPRA
jgi:hypothetical protein